MFLYSLGSLLYAAISKAPAVIAGLEFDSQGLIYSYGLIGILATMVIVASSSTFLAKVLYRIKCKSLRFYDMEQELNSVRAELTSLSVNGVPQFNLRHTILVGLLKGKLESLDIPTPQDPRERVFLLHEWLDFLTQLIVYCEGRKYQEAKYLHRSEQE